MRSNHTPAVVFIRLLLALSVLSFCSMAIAMTEFKCKNIFAGHFQSNELIHYLTELTRTGDLKLPKLKRMRELLNNGQLTNPIISSTTLNNSTQFLQQLTLHKIIDETSPNFEELKVWLDEIIAAEDANLIESTVAKKQTQESATQLTFHRVSPGNFVAFTLTAEYTKCEYKEARLPYPFRMMQTLVTQQQWFEVMGDNPSHFASGLDSIDRNVGQKIIKLRPNNPVERITWWSVLAFCNELSRKYNLKPVYNLQNIPFKDLRKSSTDKDEEYKKLSAAEILEIAAAGSLSADVVYIKKVLGDDTNIYHTEGFRLPTSAEHQFMRQLPASEYQKPSFAVLDSFFLNHAWLAENSGGSTHPVGDRQPVYIDGRMFFDLFGNVEEYSTDQGILDMTRHLEYPRLEEFRTIHVATSDFSMSAVRFLPHYITSRETRGQFSSIGFRLAQSIPEDAVP